jgi:ribonuclease D
MDIELVTDPAEAAALLAAFEETLLGLDVERGDGERYVREAALVQVGVPGRCVLLDAVALGDLSPLAVYLRDRVAILHAIENDLEPLDNAGVVLAPNGSVADEDVADTAIAAALLGLPTGLGPLLNEVLGVELDGDKGRMQRADWEARPLTEEMISYAAEDVVHLPQLWEELGRRLRETDRHRWYVQELEATIRYARTENRSWRKTRGVGRLDGHGRAVLRELWSEREAIARELDRAPQRVARDEALVAMAAEAPESRGGLKGAGLRSAQIREHGARFLQAVRRGAQSPDEPSATGHRRADDEDHAAYDRMRRRRSEIARELGIDPGVLCPNRLLWSATLAGPESEEELADAGGLRPWQREVLGEALWKAYRSE